MVDSQLSPPSSGRKLFFGLFVFPLLIAVGMAVLLCTVVLLTREVETPEALITSIKTGAPSKRWQKAFELSNELNRDPGMLRSDAVMKEVIHILTNRQEYDAKTRSYMAIALSRFDDEEVSQALQRALADETAEEVQLYLIWALGQTHETQAARQIEGFLGSESEALKKMASYVLGVLGDRQSAGPLADLLKDPSRDVRWNTAVALARLGSADGVETLMKMMDRKSMSELEGLSEAKTEEIMVNAVKAAALLQQSEIVPILENLSKNDPSLKVRQAAIAALQEEKKPF